MLVKPRGPGALAILWLTVAGDRDETGLTQLRQQSQSAGDLIAIHLREPDIEQNHLRSEGYGVTQCVGWGIGLLDGVTLEREECGERIGGVAVIVDDEDARGTRSRRAGPRR